MPALQLLAGSHAYARIQRQGLQPGDIRVLAAAAGGPKWLILNRLDRALFGSWFKGQQQPVTAVGSSIGAWRIACLAQRDPIAAIERFEAAYLAQRYSAKPDAAEISAVGRGVLAALLGASGAEEILSHPWLQPVIVSAACRGWLNSHHLTAQKAGLLLAAAANGVSRRCLANLLQRHLHHAPGAVLNLQDGFATEQHVLQAADVPAALMASAAIPLVMQPVRGFVDAPARAHIDGGMIDYHMDLPLPAQDGITLLPHFGPRVIPGWLDKWLPWRAPRHLQNTLILCPSLELRASLPGGHVPDRQDFHHHAGDDAQRIKNWKTAIAMGQAMADEFMDLAATQGFAGRVQPLP